jgi:hypothetical protein
MVLNTHLPKWLKLKTGVIATGEEEDQRELPVIGGRNIRWYNHECFL